MALPLEKDKPAELHGSVLQSRETALRIFPAIKTLEYNFHTAFRNGGIS